MAKVLITGGCGFIGTNLIRYILSDVPDFSIVNYDLLTYAGNLENTAGLEAAYPGRYEFIRGDISDAAKVNEVFEEKGFDLILNLAAESHVDRSIEAAGVFIRTNVMGTQVLLDAAQKHKVGRFLHVSTDEVYGALGATGAFTEDLPFKPNSPYSASKASADLLVRAYVKTFGLDAVITRCSNNYGAYQFPEKLIPLIIANALEDKDLPVYGDGRNVRDWIHVTDHARGIVTVALKGRTGEAYNMGGNAEKMNIEIVKLILTHMNKPESLIKYVKDRPGHDFRYAMDFSKIEKELGWRPLKTFDEGISSTIEWYITNRPWWEKIRTGDYLNYYDRMYSNR